jgi:gamma-glutamyltranspeptidase/glutathione hydrolase
VPVGKHDLQRHTATVEPPLAAEVGATRLWTSPPNSQGYLLPLLLLAQERLQRAAAGSDGALVELFLRAERDRETVLADPRHMVVSDVLSVDRLLADDLGDAAPRRRVQRERPDGDTVAVAAVAEDGTAVSLLQSLYCSFGSGVYDPGTGVILHNRGSLFSADPSSPNSVQAGKRPLHTLMPAVVEHADGRLFANATMGGQAQPQIHVQLLASLLGGMTAADAVAAPRLAVSEAGAYSLRELATERDLSDGERRSAERLGMAVRRHGSLDDSLGHAMVCSLDRDGVLAAGADPRSDGATFVGQR